MKIIEPAFEIIDEINGEELLKKIEKAGRVCYKSEGKITKDSAGKFKLTLYLIFDYPYKYYTFKLFEV